MQNAPKLLIAVIFAAFFAISCTSGGAENSNSNGASANTADSSKSNAVKDNADELELTIKLPYHPEEVVWREEVLGKPGDSRVPAPTDKKLTAVVRFLKDDAAKVVEQAGKYNAAAPATIPTENWFPAELIAQSQTSGDETIKGASYPANDFLNPPYSDGKITRIDGTDYFVLELFAK